MKLDPTIHAFLAQMLPLVVGMILGTAAMWHEARKAERRGIEKGRRQVEDRFAKEIRETTRRVRIECGLPPEPTAPPMPRQLKAELLKRFDTATTAH